MAQVPNHAALAAAEKIKATESLGVNWTSVVGTEACISHIIPNEPQKIEQLAICSGRAIDSIEVFYNKGSEKVGGTHGKKDIFKLNPNAAITCVHVYVGTTKWKGYVTGLQFETSDSVTSPFYGDKGNSLLKTIRLPGPLVLIGFGEKEKRGSPSVYAGSISFGSINWNFSDIDYDINNASYNRTNTGLELTSMLSENDTNIEQEAEIKLCKTVNETASLIYNSGIRISAGIEIQFNAPSITKDKISINTDAHHGLQYGKETNIANEYSSTVKIKIPAKSAVRAVLVADRATFLIPYTLHLKTANGHVGVSKGQYKTNSCYNIVVKYQEIPKN